DGGDEGSSADDSSENETTGDAGADPSEMDAGAEPDSGGSSDTDETDETDSTSDAGGGTEGDGGAGGEPGARSKEYTQTAPDWSCGDRDPGDVEAVPSNIEDDTTWSGTVNLQGTVRLRDAELTIEPGTR